MPNDTSTLSGALLEMKDQLISELADKGVTASYDPSTGLLGLIGRISDIQTGGSCYHIEFSEDSYTAVGGSATLEVMLQSNYAPLSGATVTVTGSDSSLYTGLTNSQGIAEITVSNVTGTVTFTGSYSNVSSTCTVTGQTYLFYDACNSSTGLSNYDTIILGEGSSTSYSMTYDSTMNAYQLSHSNNNTKSLVINDLINEDEFTLELEFYYPTSASTNIFHTGIAITNNTSYFTGVGTMYDNAWKFETVNYSNKSWAGHQNAQTISDPKGQWNKLSITVQGLSVSAKMTIGSTEYTFTKTLNSNLSSSSRQFGISFVSGTSSVAYIRNIKAEAL